MWHRKIVACIHILILSLCITLTIVPALALDVADGLYKIAPDLQNQLYSAKNESQNEKVSAIVIMEHLPPHLDLNCKDATGLQRRQIIHSMRSLAENSQKDTLALLEKQKSLGDVEDVRAFWIVNAIAVKATPEVLEQLAQRPEVKLIEQDYKVKALGETLPWGVDRIDAELVWNGTENGTDVVAGRNAGDGINVAIIDTGVDMDHPDLADNMKGGHRFVDNGTTSDDDYMDDFGHGTHCAGIIAAVDNDIGVIGVSPHVSLYAVKVFKQYEDGYYAYVSDVVRGIEWAVDNGMKIISMSLGSNSYSAALQDACDNTYNTGLLLVAAAGNDGNAEGTDDNVDYPARYDSVIAVAATDKNNKRAISQIWNSSTGPAVELAAPGVSIYSTWRNDTYAISNGTSMACPHVAGTAALVWKAYPEYNNTQVREKLQSTAEDLGASGRDDEFGYGLVDTENATPPASITNFANTTGNFWINWTWTNPPDADFNHTMVYINGTLGENVSTPQNYYNNTYTPHATRTISTHTVDISGNINLNWVNQTTTIPNNVPVLEAIEDRKINETETLTIDVNATDLDKDSLTYSCNRTELFADFNTTTGEGNWTPSHEEAGIYYIDFDVADGYEGMDNDTVKITVNDVTPPTITNLQPAENYFINDATPTISANYSDVSGINVSSVEMRVDGDIVTPDSLSETGVSYTPTANLSDGPHTIIVNVSDNCTNSNSTSWSFTVDITLPHSITSLNKTAVGVTWINWTWINPSDADFNHTEVWINGTFNNVHEPDHSYNATNLLPNTTYEIGTRTVDDSGNVNSSWVNDTAITFTTKVPPTEEEGHAGSSGGGGGGGPISNVPTDSKGIVRYTVTLTSRDENALLKIPKGTTVLDAQGNPLTTSISILRMPLEGTVAAYDLRQNGVKFEPSVEFIINYDPAKIPEGATESDLVIKMLENGTWTLIETTINMTAHTATTKLSHFTVFALFAAVVPAPTPEVAPMSIPTPPEVTPMPSPTPSPTPTPCFEAVFAIACLFAVAYQVLRKKRKW
jgi:subtilisin